MSGIKKINLADNAVSKETLYNDGDIAIGNSLRGSEGEDAFMFDFHVMVLCTGGEISFRINSTPYTMRKNDVLICPPDMIVSGIRKSDGMQCRSIAVSPGYFRRILPMVNIDWNAKMAFETHPVFSLDEKDAALFCQYHALLQKKVASNLGKHRTEVIGSLMLAFLYEFGDVVDRFVERQGHTFSSAETIFNNFINMLTDMRPKKRSVNFYAGRLHITPKYLTAVCSGVSGCPASKIIDTYVVKDISYMLRYTRKSVKEISCDLDFPNISFFGKYVKKHLGVSPKNYRERFVKDAGTETGRDAAKKRE